MEINPLRDGIDHINVYSRSKTAIGKMLSNFCPCSLKTRDGEFHSVEAYWYWLGIEDCPEKEILRTLSGNEAKSAGKDLKKIKGRRLDDAFEEKILDAILQKMYQNKELVLSSKVLPLEHYYVFNSKVVNVKAKHKWMIAGIEKIRQNILKGEI